MSKDVDDVGQWSVDKLDILSKYLQGYTTVLKNFKNLKPIYIDAFSSSGLHVHRETGEFIQGSPLRAIEHSGVFRHFHFIDLDEAKVSMLRTSTGPRNDVTVHCGDCNEVVVKEILPKYPYDQFYRILAFVDPYGMHVSWELIQGLGCMKGAEMLLHFPIADINRNALHRTGANPDVVQQQRLTRLWGDESWKESLYNSGVQGSLFGDDEKVSHKQDNLRVVNGFRKRLKEEGGFTNVPEATEVCGPGGNVIYFLIFAGHNDAGAKIASSILSTYRSRRR